MTKKLLNTFITPEGTKCSDCGEPCKIIPLDSAFDYAGTHCTHGASGTHQPTDYGTPVSDCCERDVHDRHGHFLSDIQCHEPAWMRA